MNTVSDRHPGSEPSHELARLDSMDIRLDARLSRVEMELASHTGACVVRQQQILASFGDLKFALQKQRDATETQNTDLRRLIIGLGGLAMAIGIGVSGPGGELLKSILSHL